MFPSVKVRLCTCWISKVWPFFHSSIILFTLPLLFVSAFCMAFALSGANGKYTLAAKRQKDKKIPASLALLVLLLLRHTCTYNSNIKDAIPSLAVPRICPNNSCLFKNEYFGLFINNEKRGGKEKYPP